MGAKLTEGGGEQLSADICGNDTKRDRELMMGMITDEFAGCLLEKEMARASADTCPRADEQVDILMGV